MPTQPGYSWQRGQGRPGLPMGQSLPMGGFDGVTRPPMTLGGQTPRNFQPPQYTPVAASSPQNSGYAPAIGQNSGAMGGQFGNLFGSAKSAIGGLFPELQQGLMGYGNAPNLPLDALGQMANAAGLARSQMLGTQLQRDMAQGNADLWQRGRQAQIGMAGDIGNFQLQQLQNRYNEDRSMLNPLMQLLLQFAR